MRVVVVIVMDSLIHALRKYRTVYSIILGFRNDMFSITSLFQILNSQFFFSQSQKL